MEIKQYIGKLFIGKKFHFWCDCLLKIDITGTVVDFSIGTNSELLFHIKDDQNDFKIRKIGINHPNLYIEEIE